MRRTSLQLDRSGPWIGVTGLIVMLWLVVSTTIYAPWWGVLVHLAVLACFVPVLRRTIAQHPARATWVPLYALAAWVGVNAVGVGLLDWRA